MAKFLVGVIMASFLLNWWIATDSEEVHFSMGVHVHSLWGAEINHHHCDQIDLSMSSFFHFLQEEVLFGRIPTEFLWIIFQEGPRKDVFTFRLKKPPKINSVLQF